MTPTNTSGVFSIDDLLDYGRVYEYFEDLLMDRIFAGLSIYEESYIVIDAYKFSQVVSDFDVSLEVSYHIETLEAL